ncbi:hypothetical protein BaRGS_00039819 [Batillaria attramentaria]|uniref:Ig-like domain-containing protein n=1 Tax=Batillaria attramentaria TaxID=370345 RepID=A0ABD0J205_9CAEN
MPPEVVLLYILIDLHARVLGAVQVSGCHRQGAAREHGSPQCGGVTIMQEHDHLPGSAAPGAAHPPPGKVVQGEVQPPGPAVPDQLAKQLQAAIENNHPKLRPWAAACKQAPNSPKNKTGKFRLHHADQLVTPVRADRLGYWLEGYDHVNQSLDGCQADLDGLLALCRDIHISMAPEKTVPPTTVLTFMDYELDSIRSEVRLPHDKLKKCQGAFLRRLIDLPIGLRQPHHRIRLTQDTKQDTKKDLGVDKFRKLHPQADALPSRTLPLPGSVWAGSRWVVHSVGCPVRLTKGHAKHSIITMNPASGELILDRRATGGLVEVTCAPPADVSTSDLISLNIGRVLNTTRAEEPLAGARGPGGSGHAEDKSGKNVPRSSATGSIQERLIKYVMPQANQNDAGLYMCHADYFVGTTPEAAHSSKNLSVTYSDDSNITTNTSCGTRTDTGTSCRIMEVFISALVVIIVSDWNEGL